MATVSSLQSMMSGLISTTMSEKDFHGLATTVRNEFKFKQQLWLLLGYESRQYT